MPYSDGGKTETDKPIPPTKHTATIEINQTIRKRRGIVRWQIVVESVEVVGVIKLNGKVP